MYSSLHHQGLSPAVERGIKYQQNVVCVRMWYRTIFLWKMGVCVDFAWEVLVEHCRLKTGRDLCTEHSGVWLFFSLSCM